MNRRVERFENLTGGLNRFESGVLLRGGESPFLQNLTYRGGALCCRRGQKRLAQLRPGALCCAPELFHGWLVAHIGSAVWAVKLVRSERTERAEMTIRVCRRRRARSSAGGTSCTTRRAAPMCALRGTNTRTSCAGPCCRTRRTAPTCISP